MLENPNSSAEDTYVDRFNWKLVEKRAKVERDIAFLHKREEELQIRVAGLSAGQDRKRREKRERIRGYIQAKLSYLEIIKQEIRN